jgi:hypothetical protein
VSLACFNNQNRKERVLIQEQSVLSLSAGLLPQHSCLSPRPPKPPLVKEVEASFWVPYTEHVPIQDLIRQPSNEGGVFICFCELGELIHDTLYFLHSPVTALTKNMLLSIYTRYLNWYSSIPEGLRLGRNSTPAILFAHMCYHFAILRLFRPFLTLQLIGSVISPAATSQEAADAIQALLNSYSHLYTLSKTSSLVPYLTLGSAITHLDVHVATRRGHAEIATTFGTNHHNLKAVEQDIRDLRQMAACHAAAEQGLGVIGHYSSKQNIDIGITANDNEAMAEDYKRLTRLYTDPLCAMTRRLQQDDFL